jgi:hypothetical protein
VTCAEEQLLPSVRRAPDRAVVLADGFSCRTQLGQLAGVRGWHLAEVLADALERTGRDEGPGQKGHSRVGRKVSFRKDRNGS